MQLIQKKEIKNLKKIKLHFIVIAFFFSIFFFPFKFSHATTIIDETLGTLPSGWDNTNVSFTGYDGTYNGTNAEIISGTNYYIQQIGTGNYSVYISAKTQQNAYQRVIFNNIGIYGNDGYEMGIALYFRNNGHIWVMTDNATIAIDTPFNYYDNIYHNYVISRNGTTLTLYADGNIIGIGTDTGDKNIIGNAYPTFIGGLNDGLYYFNGSIKNFKITNAAYSAPPPSYSSFTTITNPNGTLGFTNEVPINITWFQSTDGITDFDYIIYDTDGVIIKNGRKDISNYNTNSSHSFIATTTFPYPSYGGYLINFYLRKITENASGTIGIVIDATNTAFAIGSSTSASDYFTGVFNASNTPFIATNFSTSSPEINTLNLLSFLDIPQLMKKKVPFEYIFEIQNDFSSIWWSTTPKSIGSTTLTFSGGKYWTVTMDFFSEDTIRKYLPQNMINIFRTLEGMTYFFAMCFWIWTDGLRKKII